MNQARGMKISLGNRKRIGDLTMIGNRTFSAMGTLASIFLRATILRRENVAFGIRIAHRATSLLLAGVVMTRFRSVLGSFVTRLITKNTCTSWSMNLSSPV